MYVGSICNRDVAVVAKDGSVLEAARAMREQHVGSLVVVEESNGERTPIGILTDRDLVVEILAKEVSPEAVTVGDVMSYELIVASDRDSIADVIALMRSKGVRRIPVVDEYQGLIGIIALDDMILNISANLDEVASLIATEQSNEWLTRE